MGVSNSFFVELPAYISFRGEDVVVRIHEYVLLVALAFVCLEPRRHTCLILFRGLGRIARRIELVGVVPVPGDTFGNYIRLLRVLLVELLRRTTFHEIIGSRRVHADGVLVAVPKMSLLEFEVALEPGVRQVVAEGVRLHKKVLVLEVRRDSRGSYGCDTY